MEIALTVFATLGCVYVAGYLITLLIRSRTPDRATPSVKDEILTFLFWWALLPVYIVIWCVYELITPSYAKKRKR